MLITNGDREVRAKFSVLNQRFEAAPGEPKRDLLVALQGFDVTPVNAALVLRNLNFVHASHLRENLVAPVFSYADLDTRFHLAKTRKNAFALWRQA
jgi:hypothetical protein